MRAGVLAAFATAAVVAAEVTLFGLGVAVGPRITGEPVTPSTTITLPAFSCQEDDPCWDWRTMGNLQRGVCIDDVSMLEHADPAAPYDLGRRTFTLGGRGCEALADPLRPVCWVEPSSTPEGFEVIWYPHLTDVGAGTLGFEVPCP